MTQIEDFYILNNKIEYIDYLKNSKNLRKVESSSNKIKSKILKYPKTLFNYPHRNLKIF